MGIYDRPYYGQESGAKEPLLDRHGAVKVLIGINVVIFILWLVESLQPFMAQHFLLNPALVFDEFYVHTLLTAAFSHMELWHLFFNMLFLWWFGSDLEEDLYGPRNFVVLYVMGALMASLAHLALSDNRALGASGSVMAVVVCCAFYQPDRPIYLMGVLQIKMKWLAVFYVVGDLLPILKGTEDGIGHAAHLGGALAGMLFWKLDLRLFPVRGRVRGGGIWARIASLFARRPPMRVVERPRAPDFYEEPVRREASVDSQTSQRVDELLKKISIQGIGSLTEEEREFLKESSTKYKR